MAVCRKGCPCHLSLAWSKRLNLGQERLQGMGVGRDGGRCELSVPHTMSQSLARQQWDLSSHHTVAGASYSRSPSRIGPSRLLGVTEHSASCLAGRVSPSCDVWAWVLPCPPAVVLTQGHPGCPAPSP